MSQEIVNRHNQYLESRFTIREELLAFFTSRQTRDLTCELNVRFDCFLLLFNYQVFRLIRFEPPLPWFWEHGRHSAAQIFEVASKFNRP
jgi:hypothetical protein